jgi:hypothetical protein
MVASTNRGRSLKGVFPQVDKRLTSARNGPAEVRLLQPLEGRLRSRGGGTRTPGLLPPKQARYLLRHSPGVSPSWPRLGGHVHRRAPPPDRGCTTVSPSGVPRGSSDTRASSAGTVRPALDRASGRGLLAENPVHLGTACRAGALRRTTTVGQLNFVTLERPLLAALHAIPLVRSHCDSSSPSGPLQTWADPSRETGMNLAGGGRQLGDPRA